MRHTPVLLRETIDALHLAPGKHVIDCTLGDAGHAEAILEATAPNGKLLGIDADPESLLRAKNFLYSYQNRVTLVRDNFSNLEKIVSEARIDPVSGILFDLGWSSQQFEERGRGFSFQKPDEPLDMRYDPHLPCKHTFDEMPSVADGAALYGSCTAAEFVNNEPMGSLARIFGGYGEEPLAVSIATAIEEKRKNGFIFQTVGDLVETVLETYRKKLRSKKEIPWVGGVHPATKIFQALRIAVNDELGAIERALPQAIAALASGGRLAVITFHSLEDRIVKHVIKSEDQKTLRIINKKPIAPSEDESRENPRARSAKLRVAEKI